MAYDLPIFTRCCFCVPMRKGLLLWGIFLILTQLTMIVINSWIVAKINQTALSPIVYVLELCLAISDLIYGILLIIGTKKDNKGVTRLCYIYSCLTLLAHTAIMIVNMFLLMFMSQFNTNSTVHIWEAVINFGGRSILQICLHLYILFLLKSVLTESGRRSSTNQQQQARLAVIG